MVGDEFPRLSYLLYFQFIDIQIDYSPINYAPATAYHYPVGAVCIA